MNLNPKSSALWSYSNAFAFVHLYRLLKATFADVCHENRLAVVNWNDTCYCYMFRTTEKSQGLEYKVKKA